MKVLHVCNTAGVGSIIAKFMDRLFGTESLVVQRRIFDPYGLTTYGEVWDCGARMFALRCLWLARKFDIVHLHSFDKLVPFLKILYPHKPVIIHYHGSDIRGKWSLKQKYWSKVDAILYSTRDLLDYETPKNAVHMPNPVDTEIFHTRKAKPKPKTAFHLSYNADDLAEKCAKQYGLLLTVHSREENPIPYTKLAEALSKCEYYIDVKRDSCGRLIKEISKTALEALACGCKVINWNGNVIRQFPEEHKPENICKKLMQIYEELE